MVTGSVRGAASVLIQHQDMNMNEGVHTVQNVLAEYDALKLGVFFFLDAPLATHKRAKNLYRACDSGPRKRRTSWFSRFVAIYLGGCESGSVCCCNFFCVCIRVSQRNNNPPPPPPPTLPRARRSHKRQAGRLRDRSLVSCQKSENTSRRADI